LRDGGALNVGEGFGAVEVRLAGSEEVEVGAVEEEDFLGCHYSFILVGKAIEVWASSGVGL